MAGAMRKMAVYLGLVEDEYDDEYTYDSGAGNSRDRDDERGAPRADRDQVRTNDTVRVTERDEDDLSRRRVAADRPTRDWRTETVARSPLDPIPQAPAPSRRAQFQRSWVPRVSRSPHCIRAATTMRVVSARSSALVRRSS